MTVDSGITGSAGGVSVCLASAAHPLSGRPCRGAYDARALELALTLDPTPQVVHAGDTHAPALGEYLGMGVPEIAVLPLPRGADAIPALVKFLHENHRELVLMGARAQTGRGSGLTAYAVAQALNRPIVADIVDIRRDGGGWRIIQALPRGRRRRLVAPSPLVATVGLAAGAPRPIAYARARRGRIRPVEDCRPEIVPEETWTWVASRQRPRRIPSVTRAPAADRLASLFGDAAKSSSRPVETSPDAAAQVILDTLSAEGVLQDPVG